MLDGLERLLPLQSLGPVLCAGLLWFGLNYAWLGPEVGRRLADRQYRPHCVAEVASLQQARRDRHYAEWQSLIDDVGRQRDAVQAQIDARLRQAEMAQGLLRSILPEELNRVLDGVLADPRVAGAMGLLKGKLDLPELPQVPAMPPPLPAARPEGRTAFCACVVGRALDAARLDLASHTASLRLYTPPRIASFDAEMGELIRAEACGAMPLG